MGRGDRTRVADPEPHGGADGGEVWKVVSRVDRRHCPELGGWIRGYGWEHDEFGCEEARRGLEWWGRRLCESSHSCGLHAELDLADSFFLIGAFSQELIILDVRAGRSLDSRLRVCAVRIYIVWPLKDYHSNIEVPYFRLESSYIWS